jgi:nucleotide-binding universal stress UspA family protein
LHVTDVAQQPPPTVLTLPHVPQSEWNRRLMKRLQALAQKYRSDGKVSALEPRVGTASREICKVAVELNVDLIVIATHGYIGRKRMFLGSTAERVVQHSSCAVLVVREHRAYSNGSVDPRTPTGFRLKKILAPTDFSECSRAGSDYAFRLAREFKAELRLIHVINPHAHPFSDPYAVLNTDNFLDEAGRAAQKKLYTMAAKSKARCSVRVIHGSAAAEICNPGDDDVDLIVLSTHGRTGLRHFLMGSVAEHVVRYAQCPVLVIPTRPNTASSSKLVNNANS